MHALIPDEAFPETGHRLRETALSAPASIWQGNLLNSQQTA